jgi:hypothetical protein
MNDDGAHPTDLNKIDWNEIRKAMEARERTCPSCGHCPTCGRSSRPSWPERYQPLGWQPQVGPEWTWRPSPFTYTTTDVKPLGLNLSDIG